MVPAPLTANGTADPGDVRNAPAGRHQVASLLSMPVASYVATGTTLRVAFGRSGERAFPLPLLPQHALPACVPLRDTGFFYALVWPRSLRTHPLLRPCHHTSGYPALRRSLHAWAAAFVRPLAAARCIPCGARLPCSPAPGSPDDSTSPLSEDEACHKRSDKHVWEGCADRIMIRKAVVIRSDTAPGKGTRVFKKVLLPRLPSRKETP